MLSSVFFCLLGMCTSAVSPMPNAAERSTADSDVVPDAFIIEFDRDQSIDVIYNDIQSRLGLVIKPRLALSYQLFNGASFSIHGIENSEAAAAEIANHPTIKNIWPVRQVSFPHDGPDLLEQSIITPGSSIVKRSFANGTYEPHVLTQVDLLHAAGFRGQNVKIGIIDTGVDYNHPDLGGCFGPGCVISYGYDFVDDDEDPLDDCGGHGTHVVGIVSAQPNAMGFLGVAPDAEIGMYQVSSCSGYVTTDTYIAAFNRAADDGSDIISASLGSGGGWPDDAYPLALQRIVEAGVPIVVSAANNGAAGLFRPTNPAAGRGVISTASVDPTIYPYLDLVARFEVQGSEPKDFNWVAGMPPIAELSLPLYHLGGQNSGNHTTDGCSPLHEGAPDLTGYVVLVEVSSCGVFAQAANIAERGGEYIMFIGLNDRPARPDARTSAARGIGIITPSQGQVWIAELDAGNQIIITIPDPITSFWQVNHIPNTISPGFASAFSSWGPNWDLSVKPNLAAPGSNLLSTYPMRLGGYLVGSGTSMACPFAAGVMALVGQARGTFDPDTLHAALATTSRQLVWHDTRRPDSHQRLAPVPQIGAGLVQGLDAANVKGIVTPCFLSFNDTEHSPGPLRLSLHNTGVEDATYSLGHKPSLTMYGFEDGTTTLSRFPNEIADGAFAHLDFDSNPTIHVAAGETVEFLVDCMPPEHVEAERIPVYSGYLTLNGTNGDTLAVPYLGVAASMRSTSRILSATDPSNVFLSRAGDNPPIPVEANTVFSVPTPINASETNNACPQVNFLTNMGTTELRLDLIPFNRTAIALPKNEWLGHQSLGQIPGFPSRLLPAREWTGIFKGLLADGTVLPEGRYKFVISALRIFGDRTNPGDWDVAETVPFILKYTSNP
ncbi:hypothetical protein ACJZ2D_016687 [Fusarium nematophilum]